MNKRKRALVEGNNILFLQLYLVRKKVDIPFPSTGI